MCGIVGFVGAGSRADLARMTAALVHRGPDGDGFFVDEDARVFLGHRRLSIVDLEGGAQPMWDRAYSIGVIFNGEIYNHLELRDTLERRGHVFATDHSDTEVLIHGYREWGEALPEKLNGMFAFAIYDVAKRRLFLARDRFGEKPLYYCRKRGLFAFASELSALREHPLFDAVPDPLSLQKYFAYGYLPAPNAIYRGSHKLAGGGTLVYDIESGDLRAGSYWRFAIEPEEVSHRSERQLAEQLRHLLVKAVDRRLMSDVPLGVFLSGGIDSTSVLAAAAAKIPAESIKTFTIGFREKSFDESGAARATARFFGSDHAEDRLDFAAAEALIPQILGRLDEPLGDPSIVPTFLLSRFARQKVTVALSGDGGDELFAGYDPFRALALARFYTRIMPRGAHKSARRLIDLVPPSSANMSLDFKLKRTLMGLSYREALWHPVWMAPVEPAALKDLFHAPVRTEELYSEAIALWERDPKKGIVDRALEFFTTFYLPDDILTKVDRAAMMSSLESRAVFLDNDLVEFCRKLPSRFKYRNGTRKYLLKKAIAPLVPKDVLKRPKKGFGIPIAKWLRSLAPDRAFAAVDGIDQSFVRRAWDMHRSGGADSRLLLWCWLSLEGTLALGRERRMVA